MATEAEAIVGLIRGLGSPVSVVFEEGTQAQWLHDVLKPHAERVIVCNTRGRSTTDNKSDRIDADRLSELLRLGSLKSVYHGASALLTLKELVSSYVNLVEDGTRVMLRIKALFRARAIRTPGKSLYQPSKRKEWISQLEGRGARMRAEALFKELDVLQELRPKAKAAMIAEASTIASDAGRGESKDRDDGDHGAPKAHVRYSPKSMLRQRSFSISAARRGLFET